MIFVVVLYTVFASGCHSYTAIRPTELPLLNNMHVTPLGSSTGPNGQTVTVTAVSVRSLHRPDGRTVRISGAPSVQVEARQYSAGKTTALMVAIGIVVGGLTGVITWAAIQ